MSEPQPLIVDHVIIICKGCKRERIVWPDAPLVGAAQIKQFTDAGIAPCGCGAMKLHIKEEAKPDG